MSCIQKQFVIQKLPFPVEILYLIKDYCFDRIKKVQRQKKNAMLDVLKNHVHIAVHFRNGSDRHGDRHGDKNTDHIIKCFFVYKKNVPKVRYGLFWGGPEPETYFTSQICSKCGDFINPKTKKDNASKHMRHFHERPYKKHYKDVNPFYQVQCTHDKLKATSQNF
jgi:hypothetical protein